MSHIILRLSLVPLLATAVSGIAAPEAQKKTPDQIFISSEAAQALAETEYKMDPDKAPDPREIKRYLRGKPQISVAEYQAFKKGQPDSRPRLRKPLVLQNGDPPHGAITLQEARHRFEAKEQINRSEGKEKPTTADYEKRLLAQAVPGSTWFTSQQVDNAEKYEFLEPTTPKQEEELAQETATFNANEIAFGHVSDWREKERQGIRYPRVRRSWRDVLYDEDQSQSDRQGKAISDVEGATFSFARDEVTDTDTWTVHGSLLVPITYNWHRGSELSLRRFALAPSVTYDRVTVSRDPTKDVDSLYYRLGVYMDFYGVRIPKAPSEGTENDGVGAPVEPAFGYGVQVRTAGVYVTDHDHRAGLSGFETDLEPRFHYGDGGLGYRINILPKRVYPQRDANGEWEAVRERKDFKDDTWLETQLRVWLHIEGGEIQHSAASWNSIHGSFFRLGPTTQLTLAAPDILDHRKLALTALYSYANAISGPTLHSSYFRTTLALDLLPTPDYKLLNHKLSIAGSYERGGLDLTKQDVDTYTLGLNILF